MGAKKNGLSREQAMELYNDLRKNLEIYQRRQVNPKGKSPAAAKGPDKKTKQAAIEIASALRQSMSGNGANQPSPSYAAPRNPHRSEHGSSRGNYAAVACVLFFAVLKVGLGILEYTGIASATPAQASVSHSQAAAPQLFGRNGPVTASGYSKEEVAVLTSLDARRVELEERSRRLDDREAELEKRDREFAARQTQLHDLTEMLKVDREKNEKKRNGQLEQLANVYGSMDPKEAAALIQQLDVTIALALLERMPEKRIAQILALMNNERALQLTKMLSNRA